MHQLVTMLADLLPEEVLVTRLEEAILQYKIDGDIQPVGFACVLIASKITIDETEGGAMQIMKEMEQMSKTKDLLDPGKS